MEHMRRTYQRHSLERDQLLADPFAQFELWFKEASEADKPEWLEVNAMTLSTANAQGHVTGRIVLLKNVDPRGFSFFTNYNSRKGRELLEHPQASLLFYWPHVERQIRIEGVVEKTDAATSDLYFQARPRGSQVGAVVSPQSSVIPDRQKLESDAEGLEARFADRPIPRPDYWGGYRLTPSLIEFWQGRPNRLHDRFAYRQLESSWSLERLAP